MSVSERPGVYSAVAVESSLNGGQVGKTVGIAAAAEKGTKGVCDCILSYADAVEKYGKDCALSERIKVLFLNGASKIIAVPVCVGEVVPTTEDYTSAFAALMNEHDVSVMVCDSSDAAALDKLRTVIMGASENGKYRIGICDVGGTVAEACNSAEALNCERMVMAYPAVSGKSGLLAAALAGAVAAGSDPSLPLNGAELLGVDGSNSMFTDTEISELVTGGITPCENVSGKLCVVRGITTRTLTGGEADNKWRELTTVLIIDDVIPSVRSALRVKFSRVKNNRQTRGAIRTQVIIELESKLKQEIIDSYGDVTVSADENDATVCNVYFDFTVAHGLNRINLLAHISV